MPQYKTIEPHLSASASAARCRRRAATAFRACAGSRRSAPAVRSALSLIARGQEPGAECCGLPDPSPRPGEASRPHRTLRSGEAVLGPTRPSRSVCGRA
ncbi:hypothetical protein JEQ12_007619 [Ovis aries]|uniref:Uncharacterized protein n=1 Tax=Ovis aries TaxID=9940 RepID=A0A835ZXQ8_SHEEP|nr:hypothetical protein JEQ12_007619 [Ovis aries]